MITSWDIYWITRLDSIGCLIGISIIVAIILLAVIAIFYPLFVDEYNSNKDIGRHSKTYRVALISLSIGIVSLALLGTFIPSTKEFAAIYLIPKIANNEQMKKIPDNAVKLLNAKMEEYINETLTKKDKNK
jgi:hypothetical protein